MKFLLNNKIIFVLLLFSELAIGSVKDTIEIRLDYVPSLYKNPCLFPEKDIHRAKVGLALSGGGARALVQLGVLQVLEEHQIPIDCIAGTSMGSVIGGLYAAGYSPGEIRKLIKNVRWDEIITDRAPRENLFLGQKRDRARHIIQLRFSSFKPYIPAGLTPGQTVTNKLTEMIMHAPFGTETNFNLLRIPFRAVTTDLVSGQKVLLDHGNLADALCASLAFPLLFEPVQWDSMLLVDGGMTNNIPVEDTKSLGADVVIAIDATSNLRTRDHILLPWEIVDQATTIMQRLKNQSQREMADIYFRFDMPEFLSSDFMFADSLLELGRKAALERIDSIKKYLTAKDSSLSCENSSVENEVFIIDKIELKDIRSSTKIKVNKFIALDSLPGQQSDIKSVTKLLHRIYSMGYFSDVSLKIIGDSVRKKISLKFNENPVIDTVLVSGNSIFPDSVIQACFATIQGEVFNPDSLQKNILAVLKKYRKNGYALARMNSSFQPENGRVVIQILEGRIAALEVEGNEITKEFVILREFPLGVGDVFNYEKVKTGLQNIYSTGLFNTVRLAYTEDGQYPRLYIKVNEKKFNLVRIGSRYENERKGRGFIEFVNENFIGIGNLLAFHVQGGDRDQLINGYFRADRIFKTYLTSEFNIYYKLQNHFSYKMNRKKGEYEESRAGFDFSFGQQISRLGTVSVEGRYNSINYKDLWGTNDFTGHLYLTNLALSSVIDTRDEYPFPKNGKYYQFFYEVSSATLLTSEISYFKIFTSMENFTTYFKYHTIHPKLLWGTSDLTTPPSEQFFLGGETSFLGLRERQLHGRHLMLTSLEYRFQCPCRIPFRTFLHLNAQLAGIWDKEEDIRPKDFLFGIGVKLSMNTPVGPFSFAYGRTREYRERYYFSAGFDF